MSDATATANEELHLASLKYLAYGFVYSVTTKHICQKLTYSLDGNIRQNAIMKRPVVDFDA
jgi:isochorismate hydrolase